MISFTEKIVVVPTESVNEKGKFVTTQKEEIKHILHVNMSKEDFVKLRRKTTGIYRNEFGDVTIIDTGGQTNERKKWKNSKYNILTISFKPKKFCFLCSNVRI